jgi:lysophospholipase L1-like esterase
MKTKVAARFPIARSIVLSFTSISGISLLLLGCGGGGGSSNEPAAVADSFTVNIGQTLNQPAPGVLANDNNGSMLAQLVDPPANHVGTFTLNPDGSFTYTHNGNAAATDTFTYRLVNNGQTTAMATVSLVINQPPTARNSCTSIQDSDPSVSVTLPASDPNGNNTVASYTLPSAPTHGSIMECGSYPCVRSSPFVTYVPASIRGMAKLTFNVSDNGGLSSGQSGTVTILKNGELRVMPLGDSITLGLYDGGATPNTPAPSERISYRQKLFSDLTALNPGYALRFVGGLSNGNGSDPNAYNHEGHDGFTTDQLAAGIAGWLSANPPDVILLHAGTNGAQSDLTASVNGMIQLLDNINTWAGSSFPLRIFVARIIPDKTATRDVETYNNDVSDNIDTTSRPNLSIFKVNQQTGAGINDLSSPDPNNTGNPAFYGDDVHPNQSGYDLMASKWLSDMQASSAMPTCQ